MARGRDGTGLLASVPLFADFSRRELKALEAYLKKAHFNAGEDIVIAGDAGNRFFVIAEGRAKVIVNGRARRTIGPGGFFGEMSLLDGSPRNATVRAETDVHTYWVGTVAFKSLLRENFSITQKILAELCARIRSYDDAHTH
jgi:CRP-like cAMP-binding protein